MTQEFSALQAQLNTLIQMQKEQTAQLNELQDQFNQAKGALAFIKWGFGISISVAGVIATFWEIVRRIMER